MKIQVVSGKPRISLRRFSAGAVWHAQLAGWTAYGRTPAIAYANLLQVLTSNYVVIAPHKSQVAKPRVSDTSPFGVQRSNYKDYIESGQSILLQLDRIRYEAHPVGEIVHEVRRREAVPVHDQRAHADQREAQ